MKIIDVLKVSLFGLLLWAAACTGTHQPPIDSEPRVLTGIDVLEREQFKSLCGLRVGLVTNQTGRDHAGNSTIDILCHAPGVKLVSLFSPEHGIRGALDVSRINDAKDEKTGLPIYSLYGQSRKPTPEQLRDLDAIVYDIQDIGARFYTYIATLRYVMVEAAKAHKIVVVLDRPNPINGVDIEGGLADADRLSFVAAYRIPIRHGLTVGEIATLFQQDANLKLDLRVIRMQRWRRDMWYDQTGLVWIKPSPNMPNLISAALYPGTCLFERTGVSVGRGTDSPFQLIGAPWLDGQAMARDMNARRLPGVRFEAAQFTPAPSSNHYPFEGKVCGGVRLIVEDRDRIRPVRIGLEMMIWAYRSYPAQFNVDACLPLLANSDALRRIKEGQEASDIEAAWQKELERYRAARQKSLLY